MTNNAQQVIMVGAGPTGLLIALGLAQKGIKVLVLDRDGEVNRSPRALTYMPPVLDVLDEFGVLEAAREVALQCGRVEWKFEDNGNIYEVDVSVLEDDYRFPFNLHMGQDRLAEVIMAALAKQPTAEIRWNSNVTAVSQSGSGVTVTINDGETLTGDWLIGCDGARSTIRSALDIAFEGFTWPDRYMATNINHDFTKNGLHHARFVIDPEHWALICRIDQGPNWRVTYGESGDLSDEEAVARVHDRLKYWTGTEDFEVLHVSPYRVHERRAERFREGRIFLAGDAAHIVNPLGGQGLTAGIMDAGTLVPALVGVINGTFPDAALDHYAQERKRTVEEQSMETSKNTRRLVQEADPDQRRKDEAMMAEGKDREVMRMRMLHMMNVRGTLYAADAAGAETA